MADRGGGERRPVLHDVARLAGVSHQTVSRVINDHPSMRPATKARVQAAIDQLGYRPNLAARALATNRSCTIGIITTESGLYGPNSIHRTLEEAAREFGYFAGSVGLKEITDASLTDALDYLRRQSVEGIVLVAGQRQALDLVQNRDVGVPLVIVEGDLSRAAFAVGVDSYQGALDATRHLVELGHRRIAHISGPANWNETEARIQGWRDGLTEADISEAVVDVGDWSAASGYRSGLRLAADTTLRAVFVANDQMAIGLYRALHEHRRAVPGDVSVVGFDDSPESSYLVPPLTTVRQDFALVGRRAVEILNAAIGGRPEALERLIPPRLVVRASTAKPQRRVSTTLDHASC